MRKLFRKALALVALVALLASAIPALGEEALVEPGEAAPAELGEVDLYDPNVYAGEDAPAPEGVESLAPEGGEYLAPEGGEGVAPGAGVLWASPTSVILREGDTVEVRVTVYIRATITARTTDRNVSTCRWGEWEGNVVPLYVTGRKAGTTEITVTNNQNSDQATIFVTVLKQPIAFYPDPTSVYLKTDESADVYITYTAPYGHMTFYNNNTSVCRCKWGTGKTGEGWHLLITGLNQGSTTITITNEYNGGRFDLPVTVVYEAGPYRKKGKKDGKQKNRALLIGEGAFKEPATRMRADAALMERTLKTVTGSTGNKWTTTTRYDLDNAGVKKAIYNAFKQADDDDVSLFFISTHGYTKGTGRDAGTLSLIPEGKEYMRFEELAAALKAVPGRVIILLTSCGSGGSIFRTRAEENVAFNAGKLAAKDFDHLAIEAFAAADPGLEDSAAYGATDAGGVAANTGELRVSNKFYVLTAARYQEYSWGTEDGPYTYFTKWFTDGVGRSGRMPADENRDKKVTLKEMFKYISKVGDNKRFGQNYQHVQSYPKSSGFVLFKR